MFQFMFLFYYFTGTACTNGALRLVNGTIPSEGRVEYCFEGEWAPVCGLSAVPASLMCKAMGFESSCEFIL